MALSREIFIPFLVFTFLAPLLCHHSASQPTQLSASGAGSGGGLESGQMYVVAPTLQDCPNDTYAYCETLSYYASVYTNGLSNVVFWFLPGTHNIYWEWPWEMSSSRNITLLGGKDLTNSDKTSGGMTKIVCQEGFRVGGIYVSNSNFTVVENMAIAYCNYALVFDATVNATVTNVIITDSYWSLQMFACHLCTITESTFANSSIGIWIEGSSSLKVENSIISCCRKSIWCVLDSGSITLNQIISNGSVVGLSFDGGDVQSLGDKTTAQ